MKRTKGILGASLAGFAALTMAAITTTTTEAIAFQSTGAKVRVIVPTHVRSGSLSLTTGGGSISEAYRLPGAIMSLPEPVPSKGSHRFPRPDGTSPGVPCPPTSTGIQVPNTPMASEVDLPVRVIKPSNKIKKPVTLETPRGFLDEVFGGGRMEEIINARPDIDLPYGGPDGPDRNDGRHDGNSDSIIPVDDDGSCSTPNCGSNADPAPRESRDESPADPDRGGDESSEGGDSLGHEADHTENPGETDDRDDQGNSAAVDGADAGGSGTTDNGGKEDVGDNVGRNPDEGDDPDEMRNGLRARSLNVAGMQGEAAMGGKSRSGRESGSGIQLGKTDGTGWFRNHATQHNPNADPEAGGPAEMATPISTMVSGINLSRGQAMSPTVDDQQSGTHPRDPIGPVSTQTQSAAASVDMDSHLTAAMANPMGSPMIDGNGDGNHGGPVDPRSGQ